MRPSGALAQEGAEAEFSFNFEDDAEGWTVGFADLPVNQDQSIYELDSGHRPLPDGLEGSGVYIQGHNRSDDLFMFLKRQVGGLRPNATYAVSVSIDLATNVPAGSFGIGGSPGESVFVKAGASTVEPETVEDDNGYVVQYLPALGEVRPSLLSEVLKPLLPLPMLSDGLCSKRPGCS